MRRLLFPLLLLTSCKPHVPLVESAEQIRPTPPPPFGSFTNTDPEGPDPKEMRKTIWAYFERHKGEDEFDTVDSRYSDYWGPAFYSGHYIAAGHLFNEHQLHAIVFFAEEPTDRMYVYQKVGKRWKKIYADSLISGHRAPDDSDWNGDGEKDIWFNVSGTWSYNYDVLLVDKNGDKIHPVKNFADIPCPEIDSVHKDTIWNFWVHSSYGTIGKYHWKDYRLIEDLQISFGDVGYSAHPNKFNIRYFKNGKQTKEINTTTEKIKAYVPARFADRVEEYFGH